VNFAGISGDFNEIHSNVEYARNTDFGDTIAHGPLVYAIAGGLQYASGINDGTLLALMQIDRWRMLSPVKAGDTIQMDMIVLGTRRSSKGDRGIVKLERQIVNQLGTTVQEMEATMLYRARPDAVA